MQVFKSLFAVLSFGALAAAGPAAQAQITVQKAGTATSSGSSDTVELGDTIDWVIEVENQSGGALTNIEIVDTLVGPHLTVPNSLQFSASFEIDAAMQTNAVSTFTATADLMGNATLSTVQPLERSLETQSYSFDPSDGDGWKVVFHNQTDRLFFIAHHWKTARARCYNLSDGSACPNYPRNITADGADIITASNNRNYEIMGNNLYLAGRKKGTDDYGVACFNVVTETSCGFTKLGDTSAAPAIDHPVPIMGFAKESNTKWWLLDNRLYAHCFNPIANATCGAGHDFAAAHDDLTPLLQTWPLDPDVSVIEDIATEFDFELDGTRLYTAIKYDSVLNNAEALEGYYMACLDLATGSQCSGWTAPVQLQVYAPFLYPQVYFDYSSTGMIDEVCASGWLMEALCTPVSGSGTVTDFSTTVGAAHKGNFNDDFFMVPGDEIYDPIHNQTYFAPIFGNSALASGSGVLCFDWDTRDACSSWGYDPTGDTGIAVVNNDPTIETTDYAVTQDPYTGCYYALGDKNRVYTFDGETGSSPCQTNRVTVVREASVNDNFCSSGLTGYTGAWVDLALSDINLDDFLTFSIEIFSDSGLTNLLISHDYLGAGDTGLPEPLSLGAIPSSTDTVYYRIVADLKPGEANPFAAGVPNGRLSYTSSKPAEICFKTQATAAGCGFQAESLGNGLTFNADQLGSVMTATGNTLAAEPDGFCPAPTSVGDQVFLDLNSGGTYDAGDQPAPGETVTIYDNSDGTGTLDTGEWSQTVVTDAAGQYTHGGLYPNDYCVTTTVPVGTSHLAGAGSQANPYCFSLAANETRLDIDFGFVPGGSIGDLVYAGRVTI